ncbi:MerR family transcriptional regulator [Comamonas testosteroni]|nr:MerR family transcriptional regulator [Comamonas testosteroni]
MSTIYTISDLAKEFDLTTRAIRFYEDMACCSRSAPAQAVAIACIHRETAHVCA